MDRERIEFENEILDKLSGKIFLLQDFDRKRDVIFEAFLSVYNSPRFNKFIKKNRGIEVEGFFNEFMSYGIIEDFLSEPEVEDIMINSLLPIYVHKTKGGLIKTDKSFPTREELDLFIRKLIIFSGRQEIKKINNVELSNIKGRVNIAYSPFGPQITITRAKEKPISITELIKNQTLPPEIAAQFWLYVEGLGVKPANIIIAGGPGAGKTTLLNALLSFIPRKDRLVVIEDTLELNTNQVENCSRLESDEEVSLADLVKNSLRMRPDRVIVGEVRGKEAQDLMTAMNIGKYCMGTLHASTAREAILRLENEPMNVPSVLVSLIDVVVIMRRWSISGKLKRVVGELVEVGGMEQKNVLLSSLWDYDLASSQFRESMVSSIYRDRIAGVSGRTPKGIMEEIKIRAKVIDKIVELGVYEFEKVTKICQDYAENPTAVLAELKVK
ncbi:MAG: ATPase, T2SS/T4P/T4SS family [Candidatus Omnitrophota bacterium]